VDVRQLWPAFANRNQSHACRPWATSTATFRARSLLYGRPSTACSRRLKSSDRSPSCRRSAFGALAEQPAGRVLLGLIALCFIGLGLNSLAAARWMRLPGSPR
jgi:hypothetical protein